MQFAGAYQPQQPPASPAAAAAFAGAQPAGGGERVTGVVKAWNEEKGFGFITPDGGGKDVFVHISAVERAGLTGLADAQKVTFDVESGRDNRESATNLALA